VPHQTVTILVLPDQQYSTYDATVEVPNSLANKHTEAPVANLTGFTNSVRAGGFDALRQIIPATWKV